MTLKPTEQTITDRLQLVANECEKNGHKSRARMFRALIKELSILSADQSGIQNFILRLKHIADRFEAGGHKKRARMFGMIAKDFERKTRER